MAGLLRNLITLLLALPGYGRQSIRAGFDCHFRVTPLDIGSHRLKSDRYLQLAECAQLDLIIRSGLLGVMLKNRYSFVNAAQLIRFHKPVALFSRLRVRSQVLWFDRSWVYFQHEFQVGSELSARVLVKMKFKQGRKTIDPSVLLGQAPLQRSAAVDSWNASLAALD